MSRQPDDGSWEEEAMFHMSNEIESLRDQLKLASIESLKIKGNLS